jgi:hypothetical protein
MKATPENHRKKLSILPQISASSPEFSLNFTPSGKLHSCNILSTDGG